MANKKTTDQPGSNDMQPHRERTRNQQAHDTSYARPNAERTFSNKHKSVQRPEEDHTTDKSKKELARERGGHGRSGHSSSRSGSDSGN